MTSDPKHAASDRERLNAVLAYAEATADRLAETKHMLYPGGVLSVMERIIQLATGKP